MPSPHHDVVIIGGGLAGLAAAIRLVSLGADPLLIDAGLAPAEGRIGGFAEFSGAKFSLSPAGQGLVPLAGSQEALESAILEVIDLLGLADRRHTSVTDKRVELGDGLTLRSYESIVLTPTEVRALLDRLSSKLGTRSILATSVRSLHRRSGRWFTTTSDGTIHSSRFALFAGGRTGGDLLIGAGAHPQVGKGIDVGVRIEFPAKQGLDGLRAIGPDAKILRNGVRTFCLNHPGHIYRYPFDNYSIPGGIVAELGAPAGNVGILYRLVDKTRILESTRIATASCANASYELAPSTMAKGLGDKLHLTRSTWGTEVADSLQRFCEALGDNGLVDWSLPHRVHWPLLDWHWHVFGQAKSSETTSPGLFVAGDSAGHARGLLQAAVSGWLAASEIDGAR